jgi:cytidylate kinase
VDSVELDTYRRSPFVSAEAFEDAANANPRVFEELAQKDSLLEEYRDLNKSNIRIEKKLDQIIYTLKTQKEISTGSRLQNFYAGKD